MLRPTARLFAAAALVLAAVGLAPPAQAMPRNAPLFEDLRVELVRRLDEDFTGSLERAEKKQQKAVKRALKAVEKTSKRLSKDLSNARAATKQLAKAFPDEFAGTGGIEDTVDELLDGLDLLVFESRDSLDARLAAVTGKLEDQIDAAVGRANLAIDAALAAPVLADRAKQMGKAAKFLEGAKKKANKKKFGNFVSAQIDGVDFAAVNIVPFYVEAENTLNLTASIVSADGAIRTLVLGVTGITGPGDYPIVAPDQAFFESDPGGVPATLFDLVPGTGTVEIRKLDGDRPWILGAFSFEATAGLETITVSDGQFGIGVLGPDDPGGGGGGDTTITFEVNGRPITGSADISFITYDTNENTFQLFGGRNDQVAGPTDVVDVAIADVTGPGTFTAGSEGMSAGFFDTLGGTEFTSGSITITTLDAVTKTASGSFAFSGMGPMGQVDITVGVFSTTDLQVPEAP